MAKFHPIRLHGPWQASVLEWRSAPVDLQSPVVNQSQADNRLQRRVKIPSDWSDWLGTDFCGRVLFVRNFGLPTGLEVDQRVWLVVESIDYCGNVVLNDRQVGPLDFNEPPLRIQVQSQLKKSNQLRIEVEMPVQSNRGDRTGLAGGIIGGVRLEIEEVDVQK